MLCVSLARATDALPSAGAVPDGFGVNIHFADPRPGEMEMLAAAGFKWVRMDFGWGGTERRKGEYDFSEYDRLMSALDAHQIRPIFILDYSNRNYDNDLSPHTDEGREAFARWAAAAARHFKGRGVVWEMYNEPNIGFWKPKPDVDEYAKLALAVGKALREATPDEPYIGPACSTMDFKFLEACFKAGCLEYWSAVSVHPYRQKDPETVAADYAKLRDLIKQYAPPGKQIPIISGEWGYSSGWKNFDEQRQAKYLPRELLTNLASGVPISIWYDWHDDGTSPAEPEHHFGTVQYEYHKDHDPVYDPKPAYTAMKRMTDALKGCTFEKRLDVGSDADWVLAFRGPSGRRFAAWTTGQPHEVTIPGSPDGAQPPAGGQGLKVRLEDSPQYLPPVAASSGHDLFRFGYDARPDFVAFNPKYRDQHDELSKALDAAQAEMIRQQRGGRKTFCTRQVFLEARWLVYHTADYAKARRRIDDLRQMLAAPADPAGPGQVESDGSFAPCCEAWWMRMDMTCDELITLARKWEEPKYRVKLLEKINSPQKLRAYLDSILISDIRRTGINNGLELNMATADLERFILWDGTLKELPTKFEFDPALKQTLLDYLDNTWQDPATGMWGAWYRAADGSIVKTCDLSTTFHIVSYRDSESVRHWPELIATTLAMKDGRFPFGWLEEGKTMSNHHNMDLVRLWRLGWPHASAGQRRQIEGAIGQMLDFCVGQSLQPDGSFASPEEDTLSSAFYFGVGFLHEIGYFTPANRFWTDRSFADAQVVRKRILDRMQSLKLDDSEAMWALWSLRADAQ